MCNLTPRVTRAVGEVVDNLRAWLAGDPGAEGVQPEWFSLWGTLWDVLTLWGSQGMV